LRPGAASLAFGLVSRAQTMGFLPQGVATEGELNRAVLEAIVDELREHGIAVVSSARLHDAENDDLLDVLRSALEAVDASPHPEGEWEPARSVLDDELLARLVGGISASSLHRYAAGERQTPDEVAWRLHVVARLLAGLLGSYNDYGIRRWFVRPRTALDGDTPAEVLERAGDEDDPRLQRLLSLAGSLVGAGGAT
jgi:hypothetical protein